MSDAARPGKPRRGWAPSLWVGPIPNGMGLVKPNHYLEMVKTAWENRRHPGYALRILRDGVCDGCALGTTGVRDFTMKGVHLCTVRLNLLQLNTMDAFDHSLLADAARMSSMGSKELRGLGRLAYPMLRRRGESGFRRVSWEEALEIIAARIRSTAPDRVGFYVTSRGILNETYYSIQKSARLIGTNHVDNSSRICHAPSTTGLRATLNVAASTCSYSDWIGTDLLVFFGSDVPNNQPVTTKYLYYAKRAGTKVFVVNPYDEPGMARYWVPSVAESALFGTKITDRFFRVHTGGDIAFIHGVLKALLETGGIDRAFVADRTEGFEGLERLIASESWEDLARWSGSSEADMRAFAAEYARSKNAVFVWSMGITQHTFGVQNVEAIVALALARGNVGRPYSGLMPIRGHSGVQGSSEMGCVPNSLPGGGPLNPASVEAFSAAWGFPVPPTPGLDVVTMLDAAHEGRLDVLWSVGGNYLDTLPEPAYVREAVARVPLRVHQDIVLTPQMFVEPLEDVLLLPATTRYEQPGGGTETSTERRVYFSPEIPGRRVGEARAEWEVVAEVAARVRPEHAPAVRFASTQAIRDEIQRLVPAYDGIASLSKKGDAFQWGGPQLCPGGVFPTASGKARFVAVPVPRIDLAPGEFLLSTRRGKQFNSMVQRERDPLNGARREDILINEEDARSLGFADGDEATVRSDVGLMRGRIHVAAIRPRNLQVHWPEGNVLLRRGRVDPACGIPDYNAVVRLEREPGRA